MFKEGTLGMVVDVAIIGGGVHGCSIAYHLAKKGVRCALFERSYLSSGASGRSAAGARHQFGTEVNCRLAIYNLEHLASPKEELDPPFPLEFEQSGYLWITYSEAQLQQLEKNVSLQNSLGIPSSILSPEEIKEVAPALDVRGMLGASWCTKDGHINPHTLTFAYAYAAKRLGAEIYAETPVTGLLRWKDRIRGVQTAIGDCHAEAVICAAGPWSAHIVSWAGLDVPITPERHQLLVTEPVERIRHPFVLCMDDGSYWKQCPNGTFILGWGNPLDIKEISDESSWEFLHEATKRVLSKMPSLAGVRVVRQWAGTYDVTPDSQAVVGATPVEDFFLDCGWSGHGLQFAQSIGRIMAEIVCGEEPFIDVSPFRYSRFEEGDLFFEPACI
jgi:sarcosine oxidase subunit beta